MCHHTSQNGQKQITQESTNALENVNSGKFIYYCGSSNLYNHYENQNDSSSKSWKPIYLYIPLLSILLLGIYRMDTSSYNKDTCSTIFIIALFIVARNWMQSRCHSTEEWINKMYNIYTGKYYKTVKI